MKDIVFVSGHKNPDSDSICSAIAYADYLFRIGRYNAVPVRLGEIIGRSIKQHIGKF